MHIFFSYAYPGLFVVKSFLLLNIFIGLWFEVIIIHL